MITERIDHNIIKSRCNRGRYPWIMRKQLRTDFILFV